MSASVPIPGRPGTSRVPVAATQGDAGAGPLVGADPAVPCLDGVDRPYRDLDGAASTPAMTAVAGRVDDFLPGTRASTGGPATSPARPPPPTRPPGDGAALRRPDVEGRRRGRHLPQHHRGPQPSRLPLSARPGRRRGDHGGRAPRQPPPVGPGGRAPLGGLRRRRHLLGRRRGGGAGPAPRPAPAGPHRRLQRDRLAAAGRRDLRGRPQRGVPVVLDAAQLAPHRPLPAGPDFLAFSGHKLYAPFGAGALSAPGPPSPRASRSWRAAARWTWSTWTRSSGPTRPSARRPGRPT